MTYLLALCALAIACMILAHVLIERYECRMEWMGPEPNESFNAGCSMEEW